MNERINTVFFNGIGTCFLGCPSEGNQEHRKCKCSLFPEYEGFISWGNLTKNIFHEKNIYLSVKVTHKRNIFKKKNRDSIERTYNSGEFSDIKEEKIANIR